MGPGRPPRSGQPGPGQPLPPLRLHRRRLAGRAGLLAGSGGRGPLGAVPGGARLRRADVRLPQALRPERRCLHQALRLVALHPQVRQPGVLRCVPGPALALLSAFCDPRGLRGHRPDPPGPRPRGATHLHLSPRDHAHGPRLRVLPAAALVPGGRATRGPRRRRGPGRTVRPDSPQRPDVHRRRDATAAGPSSPAPGGGLRPGGLGGRGPVLRRRRGRREGPDPLAPAPDRPHAGSALSRRRLAPRRAADRAPAVLPQPPRDRLFAPRPRGPRGHRPSHGAPQEPAGPLRHRPGREPGGPRAGQAGLLRHPHSSLPCPPCRRGPGPRPAAAEAGRARDPADDARGLRRQRGRPLRPAHRHQRGHRHSEPRPRPPPRARRHGGGDPSLRLRRDRDPDRPGPRVLLGEVGLRSRPDLPGRPLRRRPPPRRPLRHHEPRGPEVLRLARGRPALLPAPTTASSTKTTTTSSSS